ncbi:hypothetical protein BJ122_11715 [Rhodopseudomonas faecalis]|uniref:Uncharacterized protein n=1 Tax=Rhodopseudomonas faecalis TaxID=99655 RepID=A0A318T9I5_9BRAD|nr:hypothetical protein [Rhodopseudomonas faecalis]PYF01792.1 hypothetical protein BJ122_11715 [Rhodopseudomonas faecalis]
MDLNDALNRMFQKEAMRKFDGVASIPWSGAIRERFDKATKSILYFDDIARFDKMHASKRHNFLLGPVSIDPFLMDAFDCLNILISFDLDQARSRNDVGLGRSWTFEGHRIFSQIREIQRMSWPDIRTTNQIISDHLGQLSRHVAEKLAADVNTVREILDQRHPDFGFFNSSRMKSLCDLQFNFLDRNHIWSTARSTRVYVAPNRDGTIYEVVAEALLSDAKWDGFYDQIDRKPFARHETRTINGTTVSYPALHFPPDPQIAACLRSEARRFDPDAIICVSTESLADYRRPIPVSQARRKLDNDLRDMSVSAPSM